MKIFVVNVYYNEVIEPQISKIFIINEKGEQQEIQKEQVLYEKIGTAILICESEEKIMDLLHAKISDKINNFELVSVTDLIEHEHPVEPQGMALMGGEEPAPEPIRGEIIFQMGI